MNNWTNIQITLADGTTTIKGLKKNIDSTGVVVAVDGTGVDTFVPYQAIQKVEKLG